MIQKSAVSFGAIWGRRIPFIAGGTPLLVLTFVLLWMPGVAGPASMPWSAVYLFVVMQVYSFAWTIAHQPYKAVQAEIARTAAGRVHVSSWKVVFGTLGATVGLVGSGALVGAVGFAGMAAVFGVVAAASVPRAPAASAPGGGSRVRAADRTPSPSSRTCRESASAGAIPGTGNAGRMRRRGLAACCSTPVATLPSTRRASPLLPDSQPVAAG